MATKAEQHARLQPPQQLDDPLFNSAEFSLAINRHLLSLYRYMREDKDFPKPLRIGGRLAWRKSAVEGYIKILTERGAQPKAKPAKKGAK
jgi:hypothetical protein